MQVIKVGRDLVALGNVAVVAVLGAGDCVGLAYALGFLECLVRPHAGVEVCRLLLKVVHRHVKESEACAAAEEHHLVVVGNVEEFLPESAAFVHDRVPLLGAVGD